MSEITRHTPPEQLPELLFVEEAATWPGIGKTLAYELVRKGTLPYIKLGRLVRVKRDGFVAMVRKEVA